MLIVLASVISACRAVKRILRVGHSKSASVRQKPMKTQLLLGFGVLPLISLKKNSSKKLSTACSDLGHEGNWANPSADISAGGICASSHVAWTAGLPVHSISLRAG